MLKKDDMTLSVGGLIKQTIIKSHLELKDFDKPTTYRIMIDNAEFYPELKQLTNIITINDYNRYGYPWFSKKVIEVPTQNFKMLPTPITYITNNNMCNECNKHKYVVIYNDCLHKVCEICYRKSALKNHSVCCDTCITIIDTTSLKIIGSSHLHEVDIGDRVVTLGNKTSYTRTDNIN